MHRIRFRRSALEDVDSAVAWYGGERASLVIAFAASLDAVIARIRESPLQFPAVHGDVRRALLGKFPYGVFFTVRQDTVHILAVVHLHRRPRTWMVRT